MKPVSNGSDGDSLDRRVTLNSIALWIRVVVTAITTLLSTRFALQALGIEQFGVYIAVTAIPLILSFPTGALLVSTQRALNIELDQSRLPSIFSALFGLHFIAGILILIVGGILGYLALNNLAQIPDANERTALWVFQLKLLGVVIGTMLIPYEALYQNKEQFVLLSALEILRSCFVMAGAYWLLSYEGDALMMYAGIVVAGTIMTNLVISSTAIIRYPESRPKRKHAFQLDIYKTQLRLSSWSMIGGFASVSKSHGMALMTNFFFGPAGSAAFGVASQIAGAARQLVTSVITVLTPRILKAESQSGRAEMIDLGFRTAKYVSLVTLGICIPIMIELSTIFEIWLTDIPELAVATTVILLIVLIIDQCSASLGVSHLATGEIAKYQTICGTMTILTVPIAYLIGQQFDDQVVMLSALVVMTIIVVIQRVVLLNAHITKPLQLWFQITLSPSLKVFGVAALAAIVVSMTMSPDLVRFAITFTLLPTFILLTILVLGLSASERKSLFLSRSST
ncbi:MAG: hypothetical protein JJ956_17590 [Pseudomonadales bacterium]|nr:hypothetical protein [Pseudomonadales bacterium]